MELTGDIREKLLQSRIQEIAEQVTLSQLQGLWKVLG
jgi:hypothetical protein